MREFALLLCQLTIYSSVTAGILLFIKRVLKYRIPPLLNAALWLVLLLRMIFPILPESRLSVYNLLPGNGLIAESGILSEEYFGTKTDDIADESYIERLLAEEDTESRAQAAGIDVSLYAAEEEKSIPPAEERENIVGWIAAAITVIYFCGAAVTLGHLFVSYILARRRTILTSILCDDEELWERYGQLARRMRIHEDALPPLRLGDASMVSGILHPVIILDQWAEREDIPMILAHELNHYRHYDNFIILAANVVSCVMWFNPLIWIARSNLRDDIELLCDSRTLQLPSVEHARYALLLYRSTSLSPRHAVHASHMSAEGALLKRRLRRIAVSEHVSPWMRTISGILCIVVMLICLTNPVSSLLDRYSVYIENGESLAGGQYVTVAADDGISGIRFYNMIYSALKNRTGGNSSPVIRELGDGSLRSFTRRAVQTNAAFPGFEQYMSGVAASHNITYEQAAVILDTIIDMVSSESPEQEVMTVPVQIREETLEKVLQSLPTREAKALLSCYNRGSNDSDISFASCYSVETIVRIMQCIDNEWLRMKFISYYYKLPIEHLAADGEYSEILAQTKYDYVYMLQTDTLKREEQTLREILAITESGIREDVFYLKAREDLYSYQDIAALYEMAEFERADIHEEYAALGYSEYDSTSGSVGWAMYVEDISIQGSGSIPYAREAAYSMCRSGIMSATEENPFNYSEELTFGEAMHILCLLYAGMMS